jgi:hypothetical protein
VLPRLGALLSSLTGLRVLRGPGAPAGSGAARPSAREGCARPVRAGLKTYRRSSPGRAASDEISTLDLVDCSFHPIWPVSSIDHLVDNYITEDLIAHLAVALVVREPAEYIAAAEALDPRSICELDL